MTQPNQPDNVALLKRYLREAYPDPRPDHALCGLVDDIINQAKAEERAKMTEEIRRDLQAEAQRELKDFEAVIKALQDNQPLP